MYTGDDVMTCVCMCVRVCECVSVYHCMNTQWGRVGVGKIVAGVWRLSGGCLSLESANLIHKKEETVWEPLLETK